MYPQLEIYGDTFDAAIHCLEAIFKFLLCLHLTWSLSGGALVYCMLVRLVWDVSLVIKCFYGHKAYLFVIVPLCKIKVGVIVWFLVLLFCSAVIQYTLRNLLPKKSVSVRDTRRVVLCHNFALDAVWCGTSQLVEHLFNQLPLSWEICSFKSIESIAFRFPRLSNSTLYNFFCSILRSSSSSIKVRGLGAFKLLETSAVLWCLFYFPEF